MNIRQYMEQKNPLLILIILLIHSHNFHLTNIVKKITISYKPSIYAIYSIFYLYNLNYNLSL